MTTQYKRVQTGLEELPGTVAVANDASSDFTTRWTAACKIRGFFDEHDGEVAKLVARAKETNPDRKVRTCCFDWNGSFTINAPV